MKTILYIHGMGGGADSRIPSILNDWFTEHHKDIQVAVRTYDFHPDRASEAIRSWYEELHPDLVIGESLGSVHALALHREPLLLVSPALNAPKFLYALRDAARIPAFRRLLNRIYKPREGQRQILDFSPETLTAWGSYRDCGSVGAPHAFFGRRDHYAAASSPSANGAAASAQPPTPSTTAAIIWKSSTLRRSSFQRFLTGSNVSPAPRAHSARSPG